MQIVRSLNVAAISIFLFGCSTTPKHVLHDEFFTDLYKNNLFDIAFYVGTSFVHGSISGFIIDGKVVKTISKVDGVLVTKSVNVMDCASLRISISELKNSIAESTRMIVGDVPKIDSGVIVLDGLRYTIEYQDGTSSVRLDGYGQDEYEVTWIRHAKKVAETASEGGI
jgi:hypothetical protein